MNNKCLFILDPDLTAGDGVYSVNISPYLVGQERASYQLQLTVTNSENETFISSGSYDQSATCCGSKIHSSPADREYTGDFIRHVDGPTIVRSSKLDASHLSQSPGRITDLGVEYLENVDKVEIKWSVPQSLAEIKSFTLSYSDDVNTLLRGLETRDVVISRDTRVEHVTQVLPGPEKTGIVYFSIRSVDSSSNIGRISNIVYLNITRDDGHVADSLLDDTSETNYTLLGVILGIITVFSLLTILVVSVWLQRRRSPSAGKLRSLNGFNNKVSSGVNVVIDKSDSRGLDTCHTHVSLSDNITQPSSTSFANNITPTYWSASQLLADHEHRKRDLPSSNHPHHGHHYHQYYPVHHHTSHYDDHESDILEDNNNEHNTSDQSSSTIVMLNTSLSSSNTGSVRKKNITQV